MSIKTPEEIATEVVGLKAAGLSGILQDTFREVAIQTVKADRKQVIDAIRDAEWSDQDNDLILLTDPLVEELGVGL